MLLSHSHRFVFVHIFKTAGTSVVKALIPYARRVDRVAYSRGRLKRAIQFANRLAGLQHNGLRHLTGYHKFATAAEIRARLGADRWERYFTFSFVRNPFDQVVSAWQHLRRLPDHPLHPLAARLDFPDFVAAMAERGPRTQLQALADGDGRLLVDFVGRTESFARDLEAICRELGIPFPGAPHENASPRRSRDHRDYYDDATRERVARCFAADLERFGYDFDGPVDGPASAWRWRSQATVS